MARGGTAIPAGIAMFAGVRQGEVSVIAALADCLVPADLRATEATLAKLREHLKVMPGPANSDDC